DDRRRRGQAGLRRIRSEPLERRPRRTGKQVQRLEERDPRPQRPDHGRRLAIGAYDGTDAQHGGTRETKADREQRPLESDRVQDRRRDEARDEQRRRQRGLEDAEDSAQHLAAYLALQRRDREHVDDHHADTTDHEQRERDRRLVHVTQRRERQREQEHPEQQDRREPQ